LVAAAKLRGKLAAMAKESMRDAAEVEIVCPHCAYHMKRTAARLRRDIKVVCPNCGEDVVRPESDDGEDV
jgi:predicted RNA-binding Zn-ribbon protein involved in translation (DUF1610 family)